MDPHNAGKAKGQGFSIFARIQSMRHAVNGMAFILKTQHNARVQVVIAIAVALAGWFLQVSANDWRWLIVAIVLAWSAEAINTAIEYACDVASPEFHPSVKTAKDIGAAAVLICIAGTAIIGAITFWPYLFG